MPGPYNRLVIAPGNAILLGNSGGVLLLSPPAEVPGGMSLSDMQNRTWHLLREDGPDTGFPAPQTGDFNQTVVTRDLNIAIAQFISQTGIAPMISERQAVYPVFAGLDCPVPPDLISITRIEYTAYGQQPYKLIACSFEEFDSLTGGMVLNATGQPYYFRRPYAGYVRLQPQPGPANASGPPAGDISLGGLPVVGQTISATFSNGIVTVTSSPYTVQNGDTPATVALALSTAINQSGAVSGAGAFLQPSSVDSSGQGVAFVANANTPQAAGITYYATVTGLGLYASPGPTAPGLVQATGDSMMWYYSSLGTVLVDAGDSPTIPAQFHMAPVYRVLVDYWKRKQDFGQAKMYADAFAAEVKRGIAYCFDSDRASQPTVAGYDETDYAWPL